MAREMIEPITSELRARAADPSLRIGRGTLPATLRALPRGWALVTQVEPLAHLDPELLAAAGATTHVVDSLAIDALDRLPAFVRAQHLPHSVIDEADLGPAAVDALLVLVLGPAPHPTPA